MSGLEADATWQYSINAGSSWTAGTGSSFTLDSGTYAINAVQMRQIDAAGNEQSVIDAKNASAITVVAPVTINTVSTDSVLGGSEALVVTGTAAPNTTVSMTVNDKVVNVTADASGHWDYQGVMVRYIMVRKTLQNLAENNPDFSANGVMTVVGNHEALRGSTSVIDER